MLFKKGFIREGPESNINGRGILLRKCQRWTNIANRIPHLNQEKPLSLIKERNRFVTAPIAIAFVLGNMAIQIILLISLITLIFAAGKGN